MKRHLGWILAGISAVGWLVTELLYRDMDAGWRSAWVAQEAAMQELHRDFCPLLYWAETNPVPDREEGQ